MILEADSPLYFTLLSGILIGAFLMWIILRGIPFFFKTSQVSQDNSNTKRAEEFKIINQTESILPLTGENPLIYKVDTQIVEKERQRIAFELHDDTIQRMSAVRLRMEQFSYHLNKPELLEEVNILREEMSQIIKSIRLLIWGITLPEFTDKSLTSLLKDLVKKLEKIIHLNIKFTCDEEKLEFSITPAIKQSVYRMVQEVTQNFVNHSIGFILSIHVGWKDGLKIIIEDNGQGLTRREHKQKLASLQKRAHEIGAILTVTSPIGQGLYVTIELKKPLQ